MSCNQHITWCMIYTTHRPRSHINKGFSENATAKPGVQKKPARMSDGSSYGICSNRKIEFRAMRGFGGDVRWTPDHQIQTKATVSRGFVLSHTPSNCRERVPVVGVFLRETARCLFQWLTTTLADRQNPDSDNLALARFSRAWPLAPHRPESRSGKPHAPSRRNQF